MNTVNSLLLLSILLAPLVPCSAHFCELLRGSLCLCMLYALASGEFTSCLWFFFGSLFPVVRAGREFAGVCHCGAGEALECGGVGVDAERDAVGVDLVLDEAVQLLLHLGHARQLTLPVVVEGPLRHLQIALQN